MLLSVSEIVITTEFIQPMYMLTAEMVVVDTIWQLHIVMNSW